MATPSTPTLVFETKKRGEIRVGFNWGIGKLGLQVVSLIPGAEAVAARKSFPQGAPVKLFVQRQNIFKRIRSHAATPGYSHLTRFFWIVEKLANALGKPRGVSQRHDDPAAACEQISDAARIGTNHGNFQAKRFH